MRWICFISLNLLLINKVANTTRDLVGDCYLQGVEDVHWLTIYKNDPVDDFEENEFKRFSVENIEDVEIIGDDYGKYVDAKIENTHLSIFPTHYFRNFEINENSSKDPEINVRLNLKCKTGKRQLSFYQPIQDSNTYAPEFEQLSYTYNLPMPLPAEFDISDFGNKIVVCDMDISNVRLDFNVIPAEDFLITWVGPINNTNKCHRAGIKTINPLRLSSTKVYLITATDMGSPTRSTVAEFKVEINEENSLPLNPEFEYAYYTASYYYKEHNHAIYVNTPIRLKEECSKVKLEVLEYKDNFRAYCDINEISVELISNLSNDTLKSNRFVVVILQAILDYAEYPGRTALEFYIKREPSDSMDNCTTSTTGDCPACPTATTECPSLAECSCPSTETHFTCLTTTETPFHPSINFMNDYYMFAFRLFYEGYVGAVAAVVVPEEEIEYSIKAVSYDVLTCDKKSGVLKLKKALNNGIYYFKAFAEGVTSQIKTEAKVALIIVHSNEANLHSMLVEHVMEEVLTTYISLPCQYSHCTYTIIEQYPRTNKQLFKCDGKRLQVDKIDREWEEIASMKVSQYTLLLTLSGDGNDQISEFQRLNQSHLVSKRNADDKEKFREWFFVPSSLPYVFNQSLISIIIDDINDNPPIFKEGSKLVVGYPHRRVAVHLTPPYLVKVRFQATDLDVGKNAVIRYSTECTRFVIHPETGVVYPGSHAFDNESDLNFTVKATDRDGAKDGLSTYLEIEVKLLKKEHLITLREENVTLEDVDFIIQNLSEKTNMTVKYLRAAVIPAYCSNNFALVHGEHFSNYCMEIIIYAFNSENEPVESYHFQRVLREAEGFPADKIKVETTAISNKDGYGSNYENGPDVGDCIVINIMLAVLLTSCITASGAFYCFKVYKEKRSAPLTTMEETETNSNNLEFQVIQKIVL